MEPLKLDEAAYSKHLVKEKAALNRQPHRLEEICRQLVPADEREITQECLSRFFGTRSAIVEALDKKGYHKSAVENYAYIESSKTAIDYLQDNSKAQAIKVGIEVNYDPSSPYILVDELKVAAINTIKISAEHKVSSLSALYGFFEGTINLGREWSLFPENQVAVKNLESVFIELPGKGIITNTALRCKKQDIIPCYNATFDDVFGNDPAIIKLRNSVNRMLRFSPQKKENVFMKEFGEFIHKFMLYGEPGCGKTTLVEATVNYAQQLGIKINNPVIHTHLQSSDFKTKYFSDSSNVLNQKFQDVYSGKACHIITTDDMDTVFFSRKASDEHHEDKSILGTLFQALEGIGTPHLGNFVFITTTNYRESNDPALNDRFSTCMLEIQGPKTPDDYARLLRSKLKMYLGKPVIQINDFVALGKKCCDYKFNGRAIAAIATKMIDHIQNVEDPGFDIPIEEQIEILRRRFQANCINQHEAAAIIDQHYAQQPAKEKERKVFRVIGA